MVPIALIVPVTSRSASGVASTDMSTEVTNLPLFKFLIPSLIETTQVSDQQQFCIKYSIFMGYDKGDLYYDNEENLDLIRDAIAYFLPEFKLYFIELDNSMSGKIVHIWNAIVLEAYQLQNEESHQYFFMLNDDVVMQSPFWAHDIIVALRTLTAFPNFGVAFFNDFGRGYSPTFPVFHRLHLDIFNGVAFDPNFISNYADPWISDIYLPFSGSAVIVKLAVLQNMLGGANAKEYTSRYTEIHVDINGYISFVEKARRRIAVFLTENVYGQFQWTPSDFAYKPGDQFYFWFCRDSPGCIQGG